MMKWNYKRVAILVAITTCFACHKLCQEGYEGSNCNTEVRAAFEGNWAAVDSPGSLKYTDSITPGSGISSILISNSFCSHFFSNPIIASVDGKTATIALQTPGQNLYFVTGTGIINNAGTQITWTYQIINNGDSPAVVNNFTGVWNKQ